MMNERYRSHNRPLLADSRRDVMSASDPNQPVGLLQSRRSTSMFSGESRNPAINSQRVITGPPRPRAEQRRRDRLSKSRRLDRSAVMLWFFHRSDGNERTAIRIGIGEKVLVG